MAQASTTMAHKILTKMTEDDNNNNNNVLISPLSLHVAFALTLEAAAEETAAQLRTLMGFSADTSFDKVHHDMAALASEVVGATRQGGLSLATALWAQDKLPLDPGFVARAAALGGANAQTVDFAHSDAARAVINDWVEEKTHGKIAHLIPSGVLDGLTKVVITSAVHFKAKWVTKFKAADTRQAPFHLLRGAGGSVQVDMMNHSSMRIDHGAFEHHEMASLAYKDSPVTMLVLLPNDNSADALQRVRDAVGDLGSQVKELVRKEVRLAMPRFKVETNVELSALLKLMGVSEPFGQTANFSRLTTTEEAARGLYVSQVFHKTFIEVDEEGTEAAAATAVLVKSRGRRASAKTEFIMDRPFVFVLYHTQLQCPLFVGQVTSLPNKKAN